MAEIYVFGTAAADILLRIPELPQPGGHTHATLHGWRPGGSAANLACGLASAGHQVHLVGPIGEDPVADAIVFELEHRDVRTEYLVRQPAATPRTLIFIDRTGERSMVGLDPPTDRPRIEIAIPPALPGADLIYVESYHRYPATLASVAPEALVAVPPPDDLTTPGRAHVVVGSAAQLPAQWAKAPFHYARAHLGDQLRWIVLTSGPRGATAYSADQTITVSAETARQLDATGAGDAFAAGLLDSLLAGEPIESAMNCAATWGAAAVERHASIPPGFHEIFDRP
jgi:site-specific DNA-methyltransferase (adenine-specific)